MVHPSVEDCTILFQHLHLNRAKLLKFKTQHFRPEENGEEKPEKERQKPSGARE